MKLTTILFVLALILSAVSAYLMMDIVYLNTEEYMKKNNDDLVLLIPVCVFLASVMLYAFGIAEDYRLRYRDLYTKATNAILSILNGYAGKRLDGEKS